MSARSFLSGVAFGAGAVWLLDPMLGQRRRAALRRHATELFGPASGVSLDRVDPTAGRPDVRTRAGDVAELGAHASRRERGGRAVPPVAALTSAAGGAIALYGFTRRGLAGRAMRAVGTSMFAAGLREIDTKVGAERRRAIDVQRTSTVVAPADAAFAFWSDVTNFPRFMPSVRTVQDLGDGRARWIVAADDGATIAWVTAVSALVPGRLLAWASEPGSAVSQVGAVRVTPAGTGSTVAVRLCYAPQGPAGEAALAGLLGDDPLATIEKVFGRAKELLDEETGRPARP